MEEDGVPEAKNLFPTAVPNQEGELKQEAEEEHRRKRIRGSEEEEEGEKEEKSGILNNFIANLMSPKSSDVEDKVGIFEKSAPPEECRSKEDLNGGGGGEVGGGILNNIISNLFQHKESEAKEEEQEKGEDEGDLKIAEEGEEEENAHGGGGGIAENVVSHLPPSLPGIPSGSLLANFRQSLITLSNLETLMFCLQPRLRLRLVLINCMCLVEGLRLYYSMFDEFMAPFFWEV